MWSVLGASVDFLHALLMTVWVLGLPLLFWHRWPRVTRVYGIYALSFIVVSQASQMLLGECFLTTLARWCWTESGSSTVSQEWFTVRVAEMVFRLAPPHRAITLISEGLILVTSIGVLYTMARKNRGPRREAPVHP